MMLSSRLCSTRERRRPTPPRPRRPISRTPPVSREAPPRPRGATRALRRRRRRRCRWLARTPPSATFALDGGRRRLPRRGVSHRLRFEGSGARGGCPRDIPGRSSTDWRARSFSRRWRLRSDGSRASDRASAPASSTRFPCMRRCSRDARSWRLSPSSRMAHHPRWSVRSLRGPTTRHGRSPRRLRERSRSARFTAARTAVSPLRASDSLVHRSTPAEPHADLKASAVSSPVSDGTRVRDSERENVRTFGARGRCHASH